MNYMYTTLVLHAHLPYVRHEQGNRLEERWLYEAIAETYIPLLWKLEKVETQKKWTISFSPTLMEMLADPLLQQRFINYIELTEQLLEKEHGTTTDNKELEVILFYIDRYKSIKQTFNQWDQNILKGFKHYFESGRIECITTSASHAVLPYIKTEQGQKAQIVEGIRCFTNHFGRKPKGFWLPECAFTDGIDRILADAGISYTFVDSHGILNGQPTPSKEIGAPIKTPHGIVLFPRNQELSNKVWSQFNGYPGDHDYREFYRDLGFDREIDYINPFLPHTNIRSETGLKYYRITGSEHKQFYNREWAEVKAREHAEDFIKKLDNHLLTYGRQSYPPFQVCLPFDAELFGHWWFEGPDWLEHIVSLHQPNNEFITCSEFITRHQQDLETCSVTFSTWGRDGYGDVWLNENNHQIYRHHHLVEDELINVINHYLNKGSRVERRALQQMVREWCLLISSDWAFMLDNRNCVDYANSRFTEHLTRFHSLHTHLLAGSLSDELLTNYENEYPFLSTIDLTSFQRETQTLPSTLPTKETGLRILMLTWEFPPMIVGGLSRHVFDLSRALVIAGHSVTVITTDVEGQPQHEILFGVEVYRVKGLQPHTEDFLHWVGSFNISMDQKVYELSQERCFDVIHAHDWLVAVSSISIKNTLQKPLIATIHATEHGRNNGIFTELQRKIYIKEEQLVDNADSVIVCSDYMEDEVLRQFNMSEDKLRVIPNGVDPSMLSFSNQTQSIGNRPIIFSVGRIVQEKGFETVIEAAPLILKKFPDVLFLIAGKGPMLSEYRNKVEAMELEQSIHFLGYISDNERNMYFDQCDIALFPSLYEPFGIVALEGMVAAKPTIVSETGGLKDIVQHGRTGLMMTPGDEQSLAEQVLFLLQNKEIAEKIGNQARLTVINTYSWDKIAKDTSELFMECLDRHPC